MNRFLARLSFRAIPGTVWILGIATLLIETSSQIVQSLLPVFLVSVLGANMTQVGFLDGFAKAAAALGRVIFGGLSDRKWGRKPVLLLGYGLMALGRPLFPLAQGIGLVAAGRFCDTISRGIAFVSRDALTGDVTREHRRGKSFGLVRSLTELGAFAGPLVASGLMIAFADDYRLVFWCAVVPAFLAFACILFGVPGRRAEAVREAPKTKSSHGVSFGTRYWILMGIVLLIIPARLSNSLLIVQAKQLGLELRHIPMVTLALSLSGIFFSYPAGTFSEKFGKMRSLGVSLLIIAAGHGLLAVTQSIPLLFTAAVLWGLHSGIVWSILPAMVIERAPASEKGSALGVYGAVVGAGVLAANVGSGAVWDAFGPEGVFIAGFWYALGVLGVLVAVAFFESGGRESL